MAITTKLTTSSRTQKLYNSTPETTSTRQNFISEYKSTGTKVAGNFVTLANGKRFRKATSLARFTSKIDKGSPQVTRGTRTDALRKGQLGYNVDSSGGYNGDDIHRQSACAVLVDGTSVTSAIAAPREPASLRNRAVTNAMLKLASEKAGIGEDLATFRQTLGLIRSPTSALVTGIKKVWADRSLRKFVWECSRSLARKGIHTRAAESYLEYVYGWKPLMQDIFGVIELMKEQGKSPLLLHATAKAEQQAELPGFTYDNVSDKSYTTLVAGTEHTRVSCSLWAYVDPQWVGLRALNQLGLLNPASLAWELVPWSFVVDWILPVGSVLSAFTARAGLQFVDGTISTRASASANLEHYGHGLETIGSYNFTTRAPATSIWSYDGYSRSTLTTWPLPGLWINTDPLGLEHGGNDRPFKALALTIMSLKTLR